MLDTKEQLLWPHGGMSDKAYTVLVLKQVHWCLTEAQESSQQ